MASNICINFDFFMSHLTSKLVHITLNHSPMWFLLWSFKTKCVQQNTPFVTRDKKLLYQ